MVNRIDRVNQLIKQELGKIIEENFCYKEVLITISDVKTSQDLRTAKAFVSIFPFEKKEELFQKLKDEFPRYQHLLNQKIHLKYIPKVELSIDESFEYGNRIEDLIDKVKTGRINS